MKNWLQELAFPYEYCESIVQSPGPDEKSGPHILKTRKNKIYSCQSSPTNKVSDSVIFSNLKYSFFSPLLFVETVNINSRKKSLLDFTVRHYIKKLNLFEQGFHFCYDLLSFNGETAVINLFVLAASDAGQILKAVPHATKPISCLVPIEYVMIELLPSSDVCRVVSVWADHQRVLILTTKGKEILSRGVYEYNSQEIEVAQWLINSKHIQSAIDLAKRQGGNQEVSLLTWGEFHKPLQNIVEQNFASYVNKNLETKIGGMLKWRGNQANNSTTVKESIFSNPSLYGLANCKKSQTFISPNYNIIYSKFMRSRYALILSLSIFTTFGIINFWNFSAQVAMENTLLEDIVSIESGIKQVSSRIPDEAKLASVVEKAKLKIELNSELNVGKFLGWITNIAPDKAVIDQLRIETKTNVEIIANKNLKKSAEPAKQYVVELNMTLNRAYSDSVAQIDTFFAKLNQRVKSPQSKFIYLNVNDKMPSALALTFFVEPAMFF